MEEDDRAVPFRIQGRLQAKLEIDRRDTYDFGETIERLRPVLAEKAMDLSRQLGRDFPEWKTTFPENQRGLIELEAAPGRP